MASTKDYTHLNPEFLPRGESFTFLTRDNASRVFSFDERAEDIDMPLEALHANLDSMTICAIIGDFHFLAKRGGGFLARLPQLAMPLVVLFTCIALQIFLLYYFLCCLPVGARHPRGLFRIRVSHVQWRHIGER